MHALSLGELAALGWLVESLSCQDAVEAHASRVLALDFEEFLADAPGHLARVLAHFGLPAGADDLARIAASGVLQRYSKAPEQPFAPGEREARLARSRLDNREEIARGMAWLDHMARLDGTVASLRSGVLA
jgi:hypothetical protein